jgi:hypothetical protein
MPSPALALPTAVHALLLAHGPDRRDEELERSYTGPARLSRRGTAPTPSEMPDFRRQSRSDVSACR